ncbi:hypothetical protein V7094_25520 [Priestia megaterium]|uniref:hypothetical protein n=1 Tax=Priestia megaterium TaxID=1404 RepID=UPI00300060C1
MIYNKKNEPYNIIERFRILEEKGLKEYCRVKFVMTGNEQVLPHEVVWRGDFEDKKPVRKAYHEVVAPIQLKASKEDIDALSARVEKAESSISVTASEISLKVTKAEYDKPEVKYIATSPQGKEIEVHDLEAFVAKNKLDMEAVQSVLDGEQKTHKKWRFARV